MREKPELCASRCSGPAPAPVVQETSGTLISWLDGTSPLGGDGVQTEARRVISSWEVKPQSPHCKRMGSFRERAIG